MAKQTLYSIRRNLEIVMESFQGLEGLATQSEASAKEVGQAMVPIIFELELVHQQLSEHILDVPVEDVLERMGRKGEVIPITDEKDRS